MGMTTIFQTLVNVCNLRPQTQKYPKESDFNWLKKPGKKYYQGQKWITVVLLLTGFILLSGCTNSSSTNVQSSETITAPIAVVSSITTPMPTTIVTTIPSTTIAQIPSPTHRSSSGGTPSAKILDTNTAGNFALVNVEFTNPTDQDLTMTAIVQITFNYKGDNFENGMSSASGVARADIKAHETRLTTAEIKLGSDKNTYYVSGIPVMNKFQYTEMVKNKAASE